MAKLIRQSVQARMSILIHFLKGKTVIRTSLALLLFLSAVSVVSADESGIAKLPSEFDVQQTADRLEKTLREAGMTVFARIDHAKSAKKAGMELRPTQLLIFGNPEIGTQLMQCQQTVALDLPQKALIWEDAEGKVWLGFNAPDFLVKRHGIEGCPDVIKKIEKALTKFAESSVHAKQE